MTSAENSVSEPPNLKIFWERIPPDPPKRLVPSALARVPPLDKNPSYGPDFPKGNYKRVELYFANMAQTMNMTPLQTTYDGLENEIACSKDTLIELLKKLSEAIASYNKKAPTLASRQGRLLGDAKKFLLPQEFKQVQKECWFFIRYTNF